MAKAPSPPADEKKKLFALIQNGRVIQLFGERPALQNVDIRDVSSVAGIQLGWKETGADTFAAPAADYGRVQSQAGAMLLVTEHVVVRCLEKQVIVPNEWVIYRDNLRALRDASTGDPATPIPDPPPWPTGIGPQPPGGYPNWP
jgi:hypothetical protein